ncbi:MAG: hypothetical protein AAF788_00075 [Pseudomonadota bacterium]
MADQDDLRFIQHFRALAFGDDAQRDHVRAALSESPGRAAGRVTLWALDRSAQLLRRFGRRQLEKSTAPVPTSQELKLVEVLRALRDYDRFAAANAALWLVPQREVAGLLDRLAPLTSYYPALETGRRAAQA